MSLKDFVVTSLILSARLSEAAAIGPGIHWPRQLSINQSTISQDPNTVITDSSTSYSSPGSGGTTRVESASSPGQVESRSSTDSPPGLLDGITPALPSLPSCAETTGTPCGDEHGDEHGDEGDDGAANDGDTEDDGVDEPGHSPSQRLVTTSEPLEVCTPLADGDVVTVYSIIYSETITWTGDPADYTAPFPTMSVPTYCESEPPSSSSATTTTTTPQLSSAVGLDDGWKTYCLTETNGTTSCTREPIFNPSFIFTSRPLTLPLVGPPEVPAEPVTSTFYITSKNPTVIFPPEKTPDYGLGASPPVNPGGSDQPVETQPPSRPPQSAIIPGPHFSQVTITADPTKVIIGTRTVTNLGRGATTQVTVGDGVYEINPSQIIQKGGPTVARPNAGLLQTHTVATPTTTIIDGLSITVSGSVAVIGGYTYNINGSPETKVVQGRTVVIAPTGISFKNSDKGVTYQATPPEATGIIVAGAEVLTAIGSSVIVIRETTITYGPGISPRTVVVDGDPVVVQSDGITLHGSTIGGTRLGSSETMYDVVGGATLTRVGQSRMVIEGMTYTVGPDTGTTTTFVGGEDITIAPDGVTVATLTIPFPFGATVVTAIPATPTTTDSSPQETDDEDEEDGASGMRPGWVAACIAIGAWALLL